VLAAATGVHPDGWQTPEHPRIAVDTGAVLAAAGLLALDGDVEAARLLIWNTVSGMTEEGSAG
jgi:hypothetical protein